jgi:hypothetical protein
MCATAANLIERVLPPSTPLRQWVLTFPFPWKPRLAQDDELLGRLTNGKLGTPPRLRSLANYGTLGPFHPQRDGVPRGEAARSAAHLCSELRRTDAHRRTATA